MLVAQPGRITLAVTNSLRREFVSILGDPCYLRNAAIAHRRDSLEVVGHHAIDQQSTLRKLQAFLEGTP